MTIAQALKKYPVIESDLLLGHVLKQPKEFLYINPKLTLTVAQQKNYESMAKKRIAGMPVAYLLGYKYFYGLKFKVNQNVLIPRPETEWLVDESLKFIIKNLAANPSKTLRILDVGTGSGCIAISIAHKTKPKKVKVFASDISPKALTVAKTNARLNKVAINFSQRNLLSNLKSKFDLIIANLPYVPMSDYKKLYLNLKYEPKLALTDGKDNFELIITFLNQAKKHLTSKGIILIEMDPKTTKYIKEFKPKLYKDFHGLTRFAKIGTINKKAA